MAQHYKTLLLSIIQKHFPDARVYLFGSRARGDARSGSDVDLALDIGKKIELRALFALKDDIDESEVPVFVDVVDLQRAMGEFREQILKYGVLWKS